MSLQDRKIQEIIASIPIVPPKLHVYRRVVYRASAGCADRLGSVMQVHKTLIDQKYEFTYLVQLDPIIVDSSSIKIRSDKMYYGEHLAPGNRVIFTEKEVWNDNVSDVFWKYSNAVVIDGIDNCDKDACRPTMKYIIQLDNVRAQNEMIRISEQSDMTNISQPHARNTFEQSAILWEEDADQIFGDFSEYVDRLKRATKNEEDSDEF